MTYEFTIILQGQDVMTESMAERIVAAGCDDCTPGSSDGVVRIHFDRDATSREEAMTSAIKQIESAGYEVATVEIDREAFV